MSNHLTNVKTEDGKLYAHTIFFDDLALENNKNIRESGSLDKAEIGLHDKADLRIAFSIPSVFQHNLWANENPEDYKLLHSKIDSERMKGARRLALMHPEWVISQRL